MPGYAKDSLHKSQHPNPTRPHHSPHQWTSPNYRSTAPQPVHPTEDSPALNPDQASNLQQLVGIFLYYARSFRPTMLVTLNTIEDEQSKSTQETEKKWCRFSNMRPTTLRQSSATTPLERLAICIAKHNFYQRQEIRSEQGVITP